MHLLHRCSCPWGSDTVPNGAYVGAYGELVAASYLRAQGLKVLRRNFRWGNSGEVDLVCRDGDTLVFCEVKSSTSPAHGSPARAVNRDKRDLLRRGARNWLRLLPLDAPYRFDIVVVYLHPRHRPTVEWNRNAFPMKGR